MAAIGLVGLAILGAGTLAIVVTRGGSGETTPDAECVRCGDTLRIGRIGRGGPFRVVVGDDVLWTSRCANARNPSKLDLEVGPDGDLLASVRCPEVSDTSGPEPVVDVDLDQLLSDEGYPPFLQF